MYEEYLGKDYHNKVRKMLTLPEEVLPDSVIDADNNIFAMKELLSPVLETRKINTEEKFNQLSQVAVYYLCGILCIAMKSRTSAPPFNVKKYQKRWDKKRKSYMARGNKIMQGLMIGGVGR